MDGRHLEMHQRTVRIEVFCFIAFVPAFYRTRRSFLPSRYLTVTADVLTSVRKMEESLKRLKRGKGTSHSSAQQGMSDDDKIRLQIFLDVQQFGKQVGLLFPDQSR